MSEGESAEISGLRHWDLSVQSSADIHHIVVANAREIVVLRELHQSALTQVRAAVSSMLSISESPNPRLEKAAGAEVQTLAPLVAELIALILAAQHDCGILQEKVCGSVSFSLRVYVSLCFHYVFSVYNCLSHYEPLSHTLSVTHYHLYLCLLL